jgi:hypothetical protein
MFKVTNAALGARGVDGLLFEAGQTYEGVELTDDQVLLLGELEGVTVESEKAKAKPKPE